MKNKLCVLILLLLSTFLCATKVINEKEYYVKPNDQFFVQVVTPDTVNVETLVLPNGKLSLYPLASTVQIADMTLFDAKKIINSELEKSYNKEIFTVDLFKIAPYSFHVNGAVSIPGEYLASSPINLYQALLMSGKLLPRASRKIKLIRKGETFEYDLNKYLMAGDTTQNPMIQNEDILLADFAKEFVTYFAYNDTVNFVQYIEYTEKMTVSSVFKRLEVTPFATDYDNIFVFKNGELTQATMETELSPFDEVRTASRARFIYVTGLVRAPGFHFYQANKDVNYYIQRSRGTYTNSSKKVYIISPDGTKKLFEGQDLQPGDTIHIPQFWLTKITSYINPLAAVAGLTYTLVRLFEITQGRG